MNEDDGTCASYLNRSDCLLEVSIYNFERTKCLWNDTAQLCSHAGVEAYNSTYICASLAIALLISVPIKMVLDYITETYLLAPTAKNSDGNNDTRKIAAVPLALRRLSDPTASHPKNLLSKNSKRISGRAIELPINIKMKRDAALPYFSKYRDGCVNEDESREQFGDNKYVSADNDLSNHDEVNVFKESGRHNQRIMQQELHP